MERKKWMIPIVAILAIGITGCSSNQRTGANEQNNNQARPMGYYSNENHPQNRSGFMSDNDGPITELMDHNLGAEGKLAQDQQTKQLQTRDENGNPPNPTVPLAAHDQNFYKKDNRFSASDANYHNQLTQNINNTGFSTDSVTHQQLTDQVRKQVARVPNVRKIRSVVYGSSLLISVELKDKSKKAQTIKAVQRAVKPYVNGRGITVTADEGTFSSH